MAEETDDSAEFWCWNFYIRLTLNDVFHLLSRTCGQLGCSVLCLLHYDKLWRLSRRFIFWNISLQKYFRIEIFHFPTRAPGPDWDVSQPVTKSVSWRSDGPGLTARITRVRPVFRTGQSREIANCVEREAIRTYFDILPGVRLLNIADICHPASAPFRCQCFKTQ